MKKAIKDFLLSNLHMAQAIREKKLPLLAEYATDKTDNDEKRPKQ